MGQRVVSPILQCTTITATTSCRTEFFDMTRAQSIGQIPVDPSQNDVLGEMSALKADHPCSPSLFQAGFQQEIIPEIAHE